MTTAALLPTPGDPRLARYWVNAYRNIWEGEVDEVRVLINGNPTSAEIYAEIASVEVYPVRIGHGEALQRLLASTDADTVVLMEDDAWVRKPGVIRKRLERVEPGLVIGCPRGGMDPRLHEVAQEKWGPVVGPDGSTGHGLWPCFLFGRREDLRCETMASTTWRSGQTVPGLGYVCERDMTTDTMTAAAFEYRARGRILPDVQYKELWQKECHGDEPWFHAGGLSNEMSARTGMDPQSLEWIDWSHRMWWWRRTGVPESDMAQLYSVGITPDYWDGKLEDWITWE